jgi:murein DD-endopeptidase MepM/ murein hydrolase activator NlpD
MGTTVVIRHNDGYVTTYSSMDEEVLVAVGENVRLGQAIGYVGCSALLETALGEHLHFSVTKDGNSIDPETFFQLGN